jgi:hypothetical protein
MPSIKQQPKTFLEIARQPHYENVISNIYAFYFDPHEEHGLGHLFINSFIECVKEQRDHGKSFLDDFQEFIIDTEYGTQDKGRIDLFLYNDKQAIIIENKVYHHLANNLNDYWKTAKKDNRKEESMMGVLLTLTKHNDQLHKGFVNVLHIDFLQKVMNQLDEYVAEGSNKYLTFLQDLYQNIKNMSEKQLKEQDLKFYLNHADKIQALKQFEEKAFDHIKTELVKGADRKEGFSVQSARSSSYQWYNFRYLKKDGDKEVDNLMITIRFNELMQKTRRLELYVEVQHDFKQLSVKPEVIDVLDKYPALLQNVPKGQNFWEYLAYKELILTEEDYLNLSDYIYDALNKPEDKSLMDLYTELIPVFKELAKIEKDS